MWALLIEIYFLSVDIHNGGNSKHDWILGHLFHFKIAILWEEMDIEEMGKAFKIKSFQPFYCDQTLNNR